MKTNRKLIVDEFTDLKVSRQRKWQLRHPKEAKVIQVRFTSSLKHLVNSREYARKRKGWVTRRLSAKSYIMEREADGN